jgi:hypothetical protein
MIESWVLLEIYECLRSDGYKTSTTATNAYLDNQYTLTTLFLLLPSRDQSLMIYYTP